MRLPGVALHRRDEPVLVRGAGLEPAMAMKHLVHDSSHRKLGGRAQNAGKMLARKRQGGCQLKVFLAGRVAVESDGVVIDEARFPGRQGRLLFAYLVAEQGRPVPRDELAEALWGETPPATWDKALSGIVSKLRGLLADAGVDGAKALTGAFGCYRLELPEGTWVDVVVAANAAAGGGGGARGGRPGAGEDAAALAASLLRQPFLPGEDGPGSRRSGASSPTSAAAR